MTIVAAGTCTIQAAQDGGVNFLAAPVVDRSQTVKKASQTTTFDPLADSSYGVAPLDVTATASSGLAVVFTSLTTLVCKASGGTVTIVKAGICTIRAAQAGNANWNAAPNVDRSFTAVKGDQTISFGPLQDRTIDATPFAVNGSATSGLVVTFASLTTPVCTISGTTVTIVAPGTCTLRSSQPGNANWTAAPNNDQSFSVTFRAQTIAFGLLNDTSIGAAPLTLSATSSSGLAVGFASLTTTICTVSGTSLTLIVAGICIVRASQPGNAIYAAAPNVDRSFAVVATVQYFYDGAGNVIGIRRRG